MSTLAPIDRNFVPYTKRPVFRRNAGLFVDGKGGGRGASRVVPQGVDINTGMYCADKQDGVPCGPDAVCVNGFCVPSS